MERQGSDDEGAHHADPSVGLCSQCHHAHRQLSPKGSHFWRCRLADSDQSLLRYPRLPVHVCPGYDEGTHSR